MNLLIIYLRFPIRKFLLVRYEIKREWKLYHKIHCRIYIYNFITNIKTRNIKVQKSQS